MSGQLRLYFQALMTIALYAGFVRFAFTDGLFAALLFYAVAALVVGFVLAVSFAKVSFKYRGRPVACPRLWFGLVAGMLWPYTIAQLATGGATEGRR